MMITPKRKTLFIFILVLFLIFIAPVNAAYFYEIEGNPYEIYANNSASESIIGFTAAEATAFCTPYGTPNADRYIVTHTNALYNISKNNWESVSGDTEYHNPVSQNINHATIKGVTSSIWCFQVGGNNHIKYRHYVREDRFTSGIADFTASPVTGGYPLDVTFNILNFDPQHYTGIEEEGIGWTFGDDTYSNSGNQSSITHTYQNPGNYTVTMYYYDYFGVARQITKTNYISVTNEIRQLPSVYNSLLFVRDSKTLSPIHKTSQLFINNQSGITVKSITQNQTMVNFITKTDNFIIIGFIPNELATNYTWIVMHQNYYPYEFNSRPFGTRYVNLDKIGSIPLSINQSNCTKSIHMDNYYELSTDLPQYAGSYLTIPDYGESASFDSKGHIIFKDNYKNTTYTYNVRFSNGTKYYDGNFRCDNSDICTHHFTVGYNIPKDEIDESVYVYATDAQSGGNIYPFNVSVLNGGGFWYNYTVDFPAGILTPHYEGEYGDSLNIYVSADNYETSHVFHFNKATANGAHDLEVPLYKLGTTTEYTNWYIRVYDGNYNTPIKLVNISIFSGLTLLTSGQTNNAGILLLNITNNTPPSAYNLFASKEDYEDVYIQDIIPQSSVFYTYITMYPITIPTPIPTPITPIPTINTSINSSLYAGTCRTQLDFNNETIWSPILNIEACVGVVNPVYQRYILTILVSVIAGILFSGKQKKIEPFLIGILVAVTVCAITELIDWILWVLLFIALGVAYFLASYGGKK